MDRLSLAKFYAIHRSFQDCISISEFINCFLQHPEMEQSGYETYYDHTPLTDMGCKFRDENRQLINYIDTSIKAIKPTPLHMFEQVLKYRPRLFDAYKNHYYIYESISVDVELIYQQSLDRLNYCSSSFRKLHHDNVFISMRQCIFSLLCILPQYLFDKHSSFIENKVLGNENMRDYTMSQLFYCRSIIFNNTDKIIEKLVLLYLIIIPD